MENQVKGLEQFMQAEAIPVSSGELVYKANTPLDHCYFIKSGRVAGISNFSDGKQYLLRYFEAGSFILDAGLLSGKLPKWDFKAVVDTELVAISADELNRILVEEPEAAKCIITGLADKYMRCESLVHIIQTHTLLWRLCSLLLNIVDQYGHYNEDGSIDLDRSINQTTFAAFLGVNRVSVVNTFRILQGKKLVSCSRNGNWHVRIHDLKALAEFQQGLDG